MGDGVASGDEAGEVFGAVLLDDAGGAQVQGF